MSTVPVPAPAGLRSNQPGEGPLRALIVGCGVIGRTHATVITRHPDVTVTFPATAPATALSDAATDVAYTTRVAAGAVLDTATPAAPNAALTGTFNY